MLEAARRKIERNNWNNIELIKEDAVNFPLDGQVDGVLCTWAMVSIPNYIGALKELHQCLERGRQVRKLDFKETQDM